MGNVFLNNYSIVRSPSLGEKTSLRITDEVPLVHLYSIGNNLGNDLILGVAEANGSKVPKVSGILAFRDQEKVG